VSALLKAKSDGDEPAPVEAAEAATNFKEPSSSTDRLVIVPLPVFAANAYLPLRVTATQQTADWVEGRARVMGVTTPLSPSEYDETVD
jgi:hypothetical protein